MMLFTSAKETAVFFPGPGYYCLAAINKCPSSVGRRDSGSISASFVKQYIEEGKRSNDPAGPPDVKCCLLVGRIGHISSLHGVSTSFE